MSATNSINTLRNVLFSANNESKNNTATPETMFSNGSTSYDLSHSAIAYWSQVVFKVVIVILGFVGMFANGFVALLLKLATGAKNERVNLLMINQLMLDMFSCASLTAVYAAKLYNLYLISTWGFWLCVLFVAETPLWIGLNGSTTNLVVIAVERYVMIVHPIWHKNNVQTWMIYSVIVASWLYGAVTNVPLFILTSNIVQGECIWIAYWSSQAGATTYGIWYFLFSYVIPIVAFCFCYGQILATIARQSRILKLTVRASGASPETRAQVSAHRTMANIVKTMVTITILFVVSWMPNSIYYFTYLLDVSISNTEIYETSLFLAFLSICLNPFVYAGQYEVIRHRMRATFDSASKLANHLLRRVRTLVSTVHPSSSLRVGTPQHIEAIELPMSNI